VHKKKKEGMLLLVAFSPRSSQPSDISRPEKRGGGCADYWRMLILGMGGEEKKKKRGRQGHLIPWLDFSGLEGLSLARPFAVKRRKSANPTARGGKHSSTSFFSSVLASREREEKLG